MHSSHNADKQGSVSHWIEELKNQNPDAQNLISARFLTRLASISDRKLSKRTGTLASGDTIAVDVLLEFFDSYRNFNQLYDRIDLWQILVRIAEFRVLDENRKSRAKKRGGDLVIHQEGSEGIDSQVSDGSLTPEAELCLLEAYQERLDSLEESDLTRIAVYRVFGFTLQEIAEKTGLSLRTIERKISLIKSKWSSSVQAGSDS